MCSFSHYHVQIPDYDIKDREFVVYFVQVMALSEEALSLSKGVKSWCVNRWFSDFTRLRSLLQRELPTCLVPSLPSKEDGGNRPWLKITSAFHFSDLTLTGGVPTAMLDSLSSLPGNVMGRRSDLDLVDSRCQTLELFLDRCLRHPRLSISYSLTTFLQDDWDAWDQLLKTGVDVKLRVSPLLQSTRQAVAGDATSPTSDELTSDRPSNTVSFTEESERSQTLAKYLQRFTDLHRQINRRQVNVNRSNKESADSLHQWCPHEKLNVSLADSIQTMAHIFDSYYNLLDLVADEEIEVDERLNGNLRYSISLTELCQREEALERSVAAERAKLKLLYADVISLEKGINPNMVPSVVGVVSSKANSIIHNIKNLFGNNSSCETASICSTDNNPSKTINIDAASTKAKQHVSKRITDSTNTLADLELLKSDFITSLNSECGYFEQQQQTDLLATLQIYATVQLRRAERCRRLWERAHGSILQAKITTSRTEQVVTHTESSPSTPIVPSSVTNATTAGQFLFDEDPS